MLVLRAAVTERGSCVGADLIPLDVAAEAVRGADQRLARRVAGATRDTLRDAAVAGVATAVAAVKAGAIDYLSKPADADDVEKALLARPGERPAPPENPMSADRVRWEHIQRVYELCDHNVSETARRLGMHRRTLQRILAKRAPK